MLSKYITYSSRQMSLLPGQLCLILKYVFFILQYTFNEKIIREVKDKLNREGKYQANNAGKKLEWTKSLK